MKINEYQPSKEQRLVNPISSRAESQAPSGVAMPIGSPTKVCLVKATVFPGVMYGCESWSIKKAECQRTDVFELWCWRILLRVLWTAQGQRSLVGYSSWDRKELDMT